MKKNSQFVQQIQNDAAVFWIKKRSALAQVA